MIGAVWGRRVAIFVIVFTVLTFQWLIGFKMGMRVGRFEMCEAQPGCTPHIVDGLTVCVCEEPEPKGLEL